MSNEMEEFNNHFWQLLGKETVVISFVMKSFRFYFDIFCNLIVSNDMKGLVMVITCIPHTTRYN